MPHRWIAAFATLLITSSASAGAAFLGELEVVSQGMAGAAVASPKSLGAAWYNPAALAGHQGLRLQVEGGFQYTPLTFQRAPDPELAEPYPAVSNREPFAPSFFAAASYDFGVKNLAVVVAAYSPVAGHFAYAERGPHTFSLVRSEPFLATIHAGVAYRLGIVSLGAMFGNSLVGADLSLDVSGALSGRADDPAFAIPVSVSVFDAFTPTFNFGARVEPLPNLAIGVSFQPPYDSVMGGKARVRLPESLSFVPVEGENVSVEVHLPWTLRAGIHYEPLWLLSLDVAFVAQGFSRYENLRITPDISILGTPLPVVTIEKRYQDTFAFRAGAELTPLPWLMLRAGVAYETSGVLPEIFDLGAPDANKVWLGTGFSLVFGVVSVDASFMHLFAPAVSTSRSRVAAVPLVDFSSAHAVTVGNGTYRFGMDVFHLGVRVELFSGARP